MFKILTNIGETALSEHKVTTYPPDNFIYEGGGRGKLLNLSTVIDRIGSYAFLVQPRLINIMSNPKIL